MIAKWPQPLTMASAAINKDFSTVATRIFYYDPNERLILNLKNTLPLLLDRPPTPSYSTA